MFKRSSEKRKYFKMEGEVNMDGSLIPVLLIGVVAIIVLSVFSVSFR